MKTILFSAAAFLAAGAFGGSFYEAGNLRHVHAQGFVLPLTDATFEVIYAAIFGIIGCLAGLMVGWTYRWLTRRSEVPTVRYWLPTPWTRMATV